MKKYIGLVVLMMFSENAHANSLTVRDIKLLGQGKVEIQLDGTASKSALEMEYVRDIVQFSIQNATIYPAKILHADESDKAFSKVFAYQYAPNLVRVRFSVDGKADQFQGKVKWEQKGKILTVYFPEGVTAKVAAKGETESIHERSLLAKVLGQSKDDVKVEKIEDSAVKAEPAKSEAAKAESKGEAAKLTESEKLENQPILRSDKHKGTEAVKLGGARPGPSALRSFMAMLLVVGGLGLALLYIKKKKGTVQAKKVGDSWISNLLAGNQKKKSLIEVVAVHPLGPKQSITVVRIRGQQLVLGVTEGNVQLITQLDSDEEIDLMDDPKVADSIGKIFGGKPTVQPAPQRAVAQAQNQADVSFGNMLKNSSGAGAIVARNAYQSQQAGAQSQVSAPRANPTVSNIPVQSSVRDQIKQRLQQGMRN